jgi:hypothetical protein
MKIDSGSSSEMSGQTYYSTLRSNPEISNLRNTGSERLNNLNKL